LLERSSLIAERRTPGKRIKGFPTRVHPSEQITTVAGSSKRDLTRFKYGLLHG